MEGDGGNKNDSNFLLLFLLSFFFLFFLSVSKGTILLSLVVLFCLLCLLRGLPCIFDGVVSKRVCLILRLNNNNV